MYHSVQAKHHKEAPLTKDDQPIALSAQAAENMMKRHFHKYQIHQCMNWVIYQHNILKVSLTMWLR